MSMKIWELGDEIVDTPKIPGFAKAKYMVTKIVPPKGKTIRDGLVVSAALISYVNSEGDDVQVTRVTEGPGGYEVEFPLGKYMVQATKYRGPKSWYNFVHPTTNKWTRIPQEKFTVEFAESFLKTSNPNWDTLTDVERDDLIDAYFEEMYLFGLACDFNFDTSKDKYDVPRVGMMVDFYRRYTPPAEDEKYGNTIITKWPNKKSAVEKVFEELDGSFEQKDATIAEAIITALTQADKPKEFDPASDENDVPF